MAKNWFLPHHHHRWGDLQWGLTWSGGRGKRICDKLLRGPVISCFYGFLIGFNIFRTPFPQQTT